MLQIKSTPMFFTHAAYIPCYSVLFVVAHESNKVHLVWHSGHTVGYGSSGLPLERDILLYEYGSRRLREAMKESVNASTSR